METGDETVVKRMRVNLEEAVKHRDSVSKEERKILGEVYRCPRDVYTGEYLDIFMNIVKSIETREDKSEDETVQDYIRRKLVEEALKRDIKNLIEIQERVGERIKGAIMGELGRVIKDTEDIAQDFLKRYKKE